MELLNKANRRLSFLLDYLNYSFNLPKINVKSTNETLDIILNNNHIDIVRFGDGEFDLIEGKNITYQQQKPELAKQLKNSIWK